MKDSSCLKFRQENLVMRYKCLSIGTAIQSVEMTQLYDFGQVSPCIEMKSVLNVEVIEQPKSRFLFRGL